MEDLITRIDGLEEAVSGIPFGIWFLVGAALVFFMQCGFAMVETGFTRAKNAGNIIMKNLMDFCIGTVVFMLLGFCLMCAEDYIMGLIGVPNLEIFTDYAGFTASKASSFVFNLVFCATAATIVSGAMAERTKFSAYCIYSAVISAVVYPIEAGWVWNPEGWLFKLGYIDFAGSSAIHMVGGVSALIGAMFLGPRLGKYVRDKEGKVVKVNAIPGHSIPLGALGVFILWFGWYGFNGAAATDIASLSSIFLTTTVAPAVATFTCMLFTWIKNGKPDVSMCLNASLAGLVAITAGCAVTDALGAAVIGAVSGILVAAAIEFIDLKLHIDDPVGAVAVHGINGLWGTLAAGLFAVDGGLFYGGGVKQLAVQAAGVGSILLYTAVIMTAVFFIINKLHGLRVDPAEEMAGLDYTEHGLPGAYADFIPAVESLDYSGVSFISGTVPEAEAIPVSRVENGVRDSKLTKIEIIFKPDRLETIKNAMTAIGITGMTVTNVMGCGAQRGKTERYRGVEVTPTLLPKIQLEMVVSKVPVSLVIETAKKVLYTGNIGDGKIFIYNVENAVKIRTGEEGYDALQDVE